MKIKTEKEKFSDRLNFALNVAYPKGLKSSQIAIKFNLQHTNQPVTQQAVYKWINGLAIPSDDKIETLSKWLNVKPEWLKYGVSESPEFNQSSDEILSRLIKGLSEQQKNILISLITSFK